MKKLLTLVPLTLLFACGDDGQDLGDSGTLDADTDTDAALDTSHDGSGSDDTSPADGSSSADVTTADTDNGDASDTAGEDTIDFSGYHPDERGPFGAGVVHTELTDASRERTIPVEIWYPTDAVEGSGESLTQFAAEGSDRDALGALLADAPADCTSQRSAATRGAPLAAFDGNAPLVVLSHCHGCTRFAYTRIAEHLASRGFVVAAPDHVGNTLYDTLRDALLPLEASTLELRAADISAVIDMMTSESAPVEVRGRIDAERIAAAGHSFGSVTTGRVLVLDDRAKVGIALAAPFESPLLPGVAMTDIAEPVLFVVATEDNSITEFGNNFIRDNFEDAQPGTYKLELVDAGHWSFTEICALTDSFDPCCGEARRQTNGRTFTYPPVDGFVDLVSQFAAAFLESALLGDEIAGAWLNGQVGEQATFEFEALAP
jgi:dienelactone hydrolase